MSKDKQILKINIITGILICMAFAAVIFAPKANAWPWDDNKVQIEMAKQIMTGPFKVITDTISGGGDYSDLWNMCTGSLTGVLQTAQNSMKGVGALIAVAIAMSHILDRLQKEQEPLEALSRGLLELFIACFILMNATKIVDKFGSVGQAIIEYFGSSSTPENYGEEEQAKELLKALTGSESGGVTWRMEANFGLIFPWLISWLLVIATKFAILQIMIEIVVRKVFVPIALADIFHEGLRSPGMRYLKRYLGAYLKIAVCAAMCALVSESMLGEATLGENPFEFMFNIVTINFAAVAMMFKAGEITNDVVGA